MRAALAYLDHVVGKACQIIEVFFLQRFPEPAVGVKSENSRERRLGLDTSCDVKFLCKTEKKCWLVKILFLELQFCLRNKNRPGKKPQVNSYRVLGIRSPLSGTPAMNKSVELKPRRKRRGKETF